MFSSLSRYTDGMPDGVWIGAAMGDDDNPVDVQ
jgi:hypothetical protein